MAFVHWGLTEREGWRWLQVEEKASVAVEGHMGQHSLQRLMP